MSRLVPKKKQKYFMANQLTVQCTMCNVLNIVGKLAGGGSVAVAVGVGDR